MTTDKINKRAARKLKALNAGLGPIKTVVRSRKNRSGEMQSDVAKHRQGAISDPPTGAIVRNTGGTTAESEWSSDTLLE